MLRNRINRSLPISLRQQIRGAIEHAISFGGLGVGAALPSVRDLADQAGVAPMTVSKVYADLKAEGLVEGRGGSGTFVAPKVERLEQALSVLTSFSEDMARRGKVVRSVWLARGVHPAAPDEMMVLGLAAQDRVARLERVRLADDRPLAIERASLSSAILADPMAVGGSLYAVLAELGLRPERAVQRISAANLTGRDAELLEVPEGAAGLRIERVSYLVSGRVVEFTRSLYRGDAYDFTAELQIQPEPGARPT